MGTVEVDDVSRMCLPEISLTIGNSDSGCTEGAPRLSSAGCNPREINGQNNHDCDPVPGGVTGRGPHPYRAPMSVKGP